MKDVHLGRSCYHFEVPQHLRSRHGIGLEVNEKSKSGQEIGSDGLLKGGRFEDEDFPHQVTAWN